jgi:MFS family permease
MLLLSLPGGVLADRVVKRDLLMWTQALTGVLAFLIALFLTTGWLEPWHVIVASVASGAVMSFNMPGRQALIAELVPPHQLMNAIALNSAGMNLTRIIAPTATGLLVAGVGMAGTYFVYSFQYVIVIAFLLLLPATLAYRERLGTVAEDFTEAIDYVRGHPIVLSLLVLATAPAIFAMPYQMLLPVFIKDVLRLGPEALGALMGAIGVGALAGSLLVAFLGSYQRKGLLMLLAALSFGILLIFFAQSQSYLLSLVLAALLGGVSMIFMALNTTLIHMAIPDEVRGRVMGLFMMSWGLMPLGTLPAGLLGDVVGVPLVVSVGGAILALVALAALVFLPFLRRLE